MATKRVAEIIVETLQNAGVKRCYGIVGDTLNHITDAIHRSDITWVHMRHEEAGAFAASGEAYLTGELTACAGSCGPGSLHFINGIYEANRSRAPVILIASQIATPFLGTDYPQEVDFKSIYSNCSVFCEQIQHPEQAQLVTAQAAQAAITKRGVAVIILPFDISKVKISATDPYKIYRSKPILRPNDHELDQVAGLLSKGKKIGIYAGAGVEGAHDELVALAEKLQAPIAHTTRAKDFVEYNNPYNLGMTGMIGTKPGYDMMMACDTLLLLGTDFAYTQFYPEKTTIIQIDENPTHIGRRHPVTLGFVGDIKPTIEALLPRLSEATDRKFLEDCLKIKESFQKKVTEEVGSGKDDLIHPQYLVKLISEQADNDAVITADSGSPMVWALRHFETNGKRRTVASLLHGTMANAMPQALGIKKAFPERQVISFSGDGGLTMLMGDMLTAIQENVDIKIVVFNNSSLNFVELEQKVEGLVNEYTNLLNPDFAKLAEVMGYKSWHVEKSSELANAVKEFLAATGPVLLDVKTNSYELVMPAKIEVSQVTNTALYGIKAIMQGRSKDVKDLLVTNFLKKR